MQHHLGLVQQRQSLQHAAREEDVGSILKNGGANRFGHS
jgi:hypothetical protein